MPLKVPKYFLLLLPSLFLLRATPAAAQIVLHAVQPTDTVHEAIPSVRLAKKKFGWNRKVYQNLVTRDNYYFNANYRLNELLKQLAVSHQDDYDRLLPMYPYTPDALQSLNGYLDSIITQSSIGIEIHDPRSKWIDNLYLLAGKAYFYKNDFTNALAAFQYINTTYAPKEKDEYTPVIGTRGYTSSSQISIATKEKPASLFRHLPSRNEALLWMIRSYTAAAQYDKAAALLSTLKADPGFPGRLKGPLSELQAWYFFKQGLYAQCVQPLSDAIAAGPGKMEKTRWEFILAQLAEENKNADGAITLYDHVLNLHPDPLMAFYARLNIVRINIALRQQTGAAHDNPEEDPNMAILLKMTRKDRYERYRGILFYALGQFENNAAHSALALSYLEQSVRNSSDHTRQKALSYLLLADIDYRLADYPSAKKYYDSTAAFMPPDFADAALVNTRKKVLAEVVSRLAIIGRQDSLQRVADMPEAARTAFLRQMIADKEKTSRRREQRSGEADLSPGFSANTPVSGSNNSNTGDWYFYNESLKSAGFTEFRNHWGNRTLADNWRLSDQGTLTASAPAGHNAEAGQGTTTDTTTFQNPSLETLLAGLPLTPEKRKRSDDSVIHAWFELGNIYDYELENIPAAAGAYDSLLHRYPDNRFAPQCHYILYLLYGKLNDDAKAAFYKEQVLSRYPGSEFAAIIRRGGIVESPDTLQKREITGFYDSTYLAYLTGDYAGVIRRSRLADSLYGNHNSLRSRFDLLQAMAIIKTQSDSAGREALTQVITKDARDTAIAEQAQTMRDVLDHKQQLIDYLSRLQIQEPAASQVTNNYPAPVSNPVTARAPAKQPARDTALVAGSQGVVAHPQDTMAAKPALKAPPRAVTPYVKAADNAWFVALEFERTDKRLLEDALAQFAKYNTSRHAADSGQVEVSAYALSSNKVMLIFRLFPTEKAALGYYHEIRQAKGTIIPEINPSYYQLFIISKSNFILLNSTKDLEGYLLFFKDHYQ